MKVLTIKQPFASLIVNGYKEYEFRTWKTKYRGEFLIHAGLGVDKSAMEKFKDFKLDYPTGCIIGKVTLTDCIEIDSSAREMLKSKESIVYDSIIKHTEWKGYGFKMENIKKIDPIYVKGKLSFWDYDYNE